MRYRVKHSTTYEYREPVSFSQHVVRLKPRQVMNQQCESYELSITPPPRRIETHLDYFANYVAFVSIEKPHTHLTIHAASQVVRSRRPAYFPSETPGWEQVRDHSRCRQIGPALEASEFLFDSPLIKSADAYAEYAARSFTKSRPILEAVLDLTKRIKHEFAFDPEATTVSTPVETVLKNKRGVCQDFAHLQIACLRSLGLPARYVSGYIETVPPPGKEKLVGSDASHAWVSFYCQGLGWIDVDPTNNLLVSQQHVTIAWGRDYSDISPVRGVILGSGDHSVKVAVDVERLDPA
jgi:transglutaminase-like putative cysteine protease